MLCDKSLAFVARRKAATFLVAQNVAAQMESIAKDIAPWKDRTPHARSSINGEAQYGADSITMSISHGVTYGRYLEKGTEAHNIYLKGAKAFMWNGLPHPIRKNPIHHPGTKPYPAIKPAAEKGKALLKSAITELWR